MKPVTLENPLKDGSVQVVTAEQVERLAMQKLMSHVVSGVAGESARNWAQVVQAFALHRLANKSDVEARAQSDFYSRVYTGYKEPTP